MTQQLSAFGSQEGSHEFALVFTDVSVRPGNVLTPPRIHLGNAISFLTSEEKMLLTLVTLQAILTSLLKQCYFPFVRAGKSNKQQNPQKQHDDKGKPYGKILQRHLPVKWVLEET